VLIGFAFGLETFFNEKRKSGKWKVNIRKLVFLGLPTFFLTLTSIPPIIFKLPIYQIDPAILNTGLFFNISEMVLGYVIITSFYKVDQDTKTM
jgi:hypothetical protein